VNFRWNEWNLDHVSEHGLDQDEVEEVASTPTTPYPEYLGEGKWTVRGQTRDGRYLQVIYVHDPDDTVYVIHSRPLTETEKRRLRRRRR